MDALHEILRKYRVRIAAVPALREARRRAMQIVGRTMKRITDPTFRYTSSANTDLRKTFARVRREQRKQAAPVPVTPIRKKGASDV